MITLADTLGWVLYPRGAASLPDHRPLEYTALTAAAALPWLVAGTALATVGELVVRPSPAALAGLAPGNCSTSPSCPRWPPHCVQPERASGRCSGRHAISQRRARVRDR